jgi:predicted amidohydrolase
MEVLNMRFKVALVQFPCRIGDKTYNMGKMAEYAKLSKKKRASLLIFPELALTGYTTRDLVYDLAEEIPGPATEKIEKIAQNENLYLIFGMPERSSKGDAILFNTAVIVGPEGYIGKYRKWYLPTHSVFEEKRYFRLGYRTPVFETDIGKLGMMICYDIFFPEIARVLRLQGARFIICISASPATRKTYFETLTTARAIENTCYLAYVNLVGIENGLQFWGGSRLISPTGYIISRSDYNKEAITFGDIDYESLKPIEAFVPTIRDLRPELYSSIEKHLKDL